MRTTIAPRKRCHLAVSIFLASCTTINVVAAADSNTKAPAPLFRITTQSIGSSLDNNVVQSAAVVSVDTGVITQRSESMEITLLDGTTQVADLTDFTRRAVNDATWVGKLRGKDNSRVLLTVRDSAISGVIRDAGSIHLLEPGANAQTLLQTIEPDQYPDCAGAVEPEQQALDDFDPLDFEIGADSADRIDLMILYTALARDDAGGVAAIETVAQNAVDISNLAFEDSNVNTRFRLVHTALASHTDSGNSATDLIWLRNDSTVASLRNTHGADMVSLLLGNGGGSCGRGYVMRTVSPSFESFAFQVTARTCAVGNLTFAHEHGHNMGMEHDPANGTFSSQASYPWSFGHNVNGSYRTVMSYSNQCTNGCTRVPHFSNPALNHNSVPTGIANQRDNHRTANLVAATVANFRQEVCSSTPDLVLENQTIQSIDVFEACNSITARNNFIVAATADVTFIAGDQVILDNGFRVADNGIFQVQLDTSDTDSITPADEIQLTRRQ